MDNSILIKCWCGAVGTHEEMFSPCLGDSCGGTGSVDCFCGGDQCVCHNHGETDCPGCPDCEHNDGYDYGDDWTEDDPWDDPDYRQRQFEISAQERQMWAEYEAERSSVG